MEQWKAIPGYEGLYEASSAGRIRSLKRLDARGRSVRGRFMATHARKSGGHLTVKLSRDGTYQTASVHRLVLLAFIGAPPDGCEALHGDGNPANNSIENLRWGTRSENLLDRVRHGVHHWALKTHCPQGHPYDETNTYHASGGRRMCRQCLRDRNRTRRMSRKAA